MPISWISHVKEYAKKNDVPYRQALKDASPSYHKLYPKGSAKPKKPKKVCKEVCKKVCK